MSRVKIIKVVLVTLLLGVVIACVYGIYWLLSLIWTGVLEQNVFFIVGGAILGYLTIGILIFVGVIALGFASVLIFG